MTRILLARHGETEYNKDGRVQGVTDAELNDTGRKQSTRLGKRLADIDIDAVYTSGLKRTKQTAAIAMDGRGLEITQVEALNERDYGVFEGKPTTDFHAALAAFDGPKRDWTPEGGEDIGAVAKRGMSAVEQITTNHGDETVLIVAHGNMNQALLASMIGVEPGYGFVFSQANTCLNAARWDTNWNIQYVNDTRHLSSEHL